MFENRGLTVVYYFITIKFWKRLGQGMVWNGTEILVWKMPEWNRMEDFKNGMEDNLPY